MITIADHTLSRLVAQTRPHVGNLADLEAIQCISFEYESGALYAMATNRYTLAVSRTQITSGDDEPWFAIVHRLQIPELAAAIKLLDAKPINLERTGDQLILSGDSGTRIAIELSPFATKVPVDWRKVILPAIERPASDAQMAMDPKFFGAWKGLPGPVQMWSTGEGKPTLIVAADFLGAQMPIRRDTEDDTLRSELDAWLAARRDEPAQLAAA
ncbi:hypothetical protein GTY41_02465 [Streptomyces sp. SID685]|uniref:hypothetical protein n=1 Tax=Streptomyces sp. SID685 TaxID=2690322 RepID=UPI001369C49E|nr:hypothetical protein [Streptomyces sp. SID685]MYR83838.1 hypothetical protein [Streptomyces sp. SID685]